MLVGRGDVLVVEGPNVVFRQSHFPGELLADGSPVHIATIHQTKAGHVVEAQGDIFTVGTSLFHLLVVEVD